jgi:N-acetylmuramoyl-L-alanine amidase
LLEDAVMRKTKGHLGWHAIGAGLLLLGGCADGPTIDWTHPSANHDSRVQFIVIHATEIDFPTSLRVLTRGDVSSHYLVDRDGSVYGLVPESERAWHAGSSYWQGATPLNPSSIGIEIVSVPLGQPEGTDVPFPAAQTAAVRALVADIVRRHGVRADRIVGHGEVQPEGRTDPGHWFPWPQLAADGLVPSPDPALVATFRERFEAQLPDIRWFQEHLGLHGYRVACSGELDTQTQQVLGVFQGRYRPEHVTGRPDAETAALLATLTDPDGRLVSDRQGHRRVYRPERPAASHCSLT